MVERVLWSVVLSCDGEGVDKVVDGKESVVVGGV